MAKEIKTNVMRVLDKAKIEYNHYDYSKTGCTVGTEIADMLGQNPDCVFKTLVTVGSKTKDYYVFMVPVNKELSLKKAAQAVGEKSIQMIPQKDLLKVAGYVHGGCSPIGMKKQYITTAHCTAKDFSKILFSAGKVGYQVEVSFEDLLKVCPVNLADIVE
ncbi:MAG: Cys-tRNA(Pro) deacylase [Acutalibacteraceae bacterium]|nr:Cys-tRNA(Pro) deacylase [Acutalibacteraceae bacterium]